MKSVRGWIGASLERGSDALAARLASEAWAAVASRRVARALTIPSGLHVVGVGGAVLGGAGKTPVAVALARALSASRSVAFVGHAYRARPGRARKVDVLDRAVDVGDDALFAARALEGSNAFVVVAPGREVALEEAARLGARVAIVDGLLQASPRLAASLLVVDGARPWGSGACPPAGDLRAAPEALLAAADAVVAMEPVDFDLTTKLPILRVAQSTSIASRPRGRLGLVLAIAHPERVVRAVSASGVAIEAVLTLPDHDRFDAASLRSMRALAVDAFATTARCATKLPSHLDGRPIVALEHRVDVSAIVQFLVQRAAW